MTQIFGGVPCGAGSLFGGQLAYRLGPELAPERLSLLEPVELGSGRLRIVGWSHRGLEPLCGLARPFSHWSDAQLSLFDFADVELSTSCSAAVTADGALRCAPLASAYAFSDDACTRAFVPDTNLCESPTHARRALDACRVAIHSVARNKETLPMYFSAPGVRCAPLGSGPTSGYALAEAVDPALFAPMHERVE